MEDIIEGLQPEAARLAFEALRSVLDTQDDIRAASTDMRRAIVHGWSVGRMVQNPEMRAEFESLPARRFDPLHIWRLEQAALASWYVSLLVRTASALSTGAKLPEELLTGGTELRQLMIKVILYMVGHVKGISTQVDDIRTGKGHIDLADDLMRLADLYDEHALALAADQTHYRPEDAVKARKIAQAILMVLGDGRASDTAYWADYQARAWSLLVNTYEEVAAAGRWLFRHENGDALFPSLYTVGRQRRTRRGEDDAQPGDEPEAPETP
jgi:hypothetical protein